MQRCGLPGLGGKNGDSRWSNAQGSENPKAKLIGTLLAPISWCMLGVSTVSERTSRAKGERAGSGLEEEKEWLVVMKCPGWVMPWP